MPDSLPAANISDQQIDEWSRKGFLIFDQFLSAPEVADLIAAVEALALDAVSSRVRRGAAFARRNLLDLPFVRDLISSSRVEELLAAVAPGLTAVRAILFDKTGLANWTVPWHQDRSIAVRERIDVGGFGPWSTKAGVVHVQPPLHLLREMLTLRFNLDSCGCGNGPLRVIEGTHEKILAPDEIETIVASREQTVCATGAGGLVMMPPLLLHASSPAQIASHRRVVHIEFGPGDLPGGLDWAKS